MIIQFEGITEFLSRGHSHLPRPGNDNRIVLSEGMTPEAALAFVREYREFLRRENAAGMTLLANPARRQLFESLAAFERCLLWMYFEQRG